MFVLSNSIEGAEGAHLFGQSWALPTWCMKPVQGHIIYNNAQTEQIFRQAIDELLAEVQARCILCNLASLQTQDISLKQKSSLL